jgi:O-antigen/teichoic acid export membrane protein
MRGVAYNLLGMLGKVFMPAFFIIVGRMYGADTLGVYILVFVFIEMLKKLTVGGLNEGIMIFASKYMAREDSERDIYQILSNSIALCIGLGFLVFIAAVSGIFRILPMYSAESTQYLLSMMALGIPLQTMAMLLVAATKAHLEMKWDALVNGFIRPFGLCFFAVLFSVLGFGVEGLGYGYAATGVVMLAVSLFIFFKYFSFRKLFHSMCHFRWRRELLAFVIPQNLNLTFHDMIGGVDVLMLGFFGVQPALIGYYGVAAKLVSQIVQVRMAFAGAYMPVIARLYGERRIDEMNASFTKVSRWTMLVAFPIGFLVIFFRREILRLFHPSFGVPFALPMDEILPGELIELLQLGYLGEMGSTGFMIVLALVPLLSCGIGLAGNLITSVGKSGWNLFNSVLVACLSFLFAVLFIPGHGISGAAFAVVLSAVILRSLQLLQAWLLVGVRMKWGVAYKPYLAALVAGVFLVFADMLGTGQLWLRLVTIGFALGVYFAVLRVLGFEEGDAHILMPWKKKRS